MIVQAPALEVTDGAAPSTILTQSLAILRFIAKIAPDELELYPSDPIKAGVVDGICDQQADTFMGKR